MARRAKPAMATPPITELRLRLRPGARLGAHPPRLGGVAPADHPDPLPGLEVLVVLEEVLDLPQRDLGHLGYVGDVGVALGEPRRRHRDDLLVAAGIILH